MYPENIMKWKKKSKILKLLWNTLCEKKCEKTCEKTCEKNGVETIVDSDGILWLNEKNIEQGLDHKNLRDITIKYHSDHRRHRY